MCNHNCNQGRNCPTPQACELPIQYADDEPAAFAVIKWVMVCICAVAGASFLVEYFS